MRPFFFLSLMLTSCAGNADKTTVINSAASTQLDHSALIDTNYMPTGFYFLAEGSEGVKMRKKGSDDIYTIAPTPFASVKNVIKTELEKTHLKNETYYELCMTFDAKGTNDLREGTGNPLHPKIAAIVANRLLFVVENKVSIKAGVMCVGLVGYSQAEMNAMQNEVNNKK